MLRLTFVLVIFAAGTIAAVRSRFGALLFYLWFALFRPQEWLWIDITAYRPSFILGLVLIVPSLFSGYLPNLTHPLNAGAALFLCAAFVAQSNAIRPDLGWFWLDFLGKLIVVGMFLTTLTCTRQRVVAVMAVISASLGFFSAKAGLVSVLSGGERFAAGLAGAFSDNNTYAVGSVMVLYLLIAAAQNVPGKWIARGFWLTVPLTAFTVVSTFSRAGFLALAVSALVFIALQRRRLLLLVGVVVLLPIAILAAPIPRGYLERLQTIQTYEQIEETSALSRLHFWRVALDMSRAHPLGVGLWNFESNYDAYDTMDGAYGRARAVHNSFLQALTETGWLGGTIFSALCIGAFGFALRVRSRSRSPGLSGDEQRLLFTTANALIASMSGFLVGGFFLSMAYNDLTWLTFATLAAVDRLSAKMCREASPGQGQ